MPITDLLRRNAELYANDTALVEVNPEITEVRRVTWKDYELIESNPRSCYRREITWKVFDEKANRFANMLLDRGVKKGDKVGILLMNCLEWLPVYFGILKIGALAVPLNFRYASAEIKYCLDLAEVDVLMFGPEFIGRIEEIADEISRNRLLFYIGEGCPSFAEHYDSLVVNCKSEDPMIPLTDEDDAAIYFSSGTTGFPKAILHDHRSLVHSAAVEQNHHGQSRDDVFLCIPPLYHTGAKMHWFGSLQSGSKAVLLKGVKPKTILETVSNENCTIVWLLVPWAQDILDAIDRGDVNPADYQLSQWRLMHIGAQPVPPSLIARWKKIFPDHLYDTNYGLSESIGPGCVHLGVENIHKVGAIGKAGFGWEVKIADEVVAIIAGLAAMEVEGVSSMAGNATRELIAKLGMKSLSKGVKVDVLEGIVTVSLALNLKYGSSIKDTTLKVQEKVKAAIENMTGLTVADVNIRVAGVDMPEEE